MSLRTGCTQDARRLADLLDGRFPEIRRKLETDMQLVHSSSPPSPQAQRALARQARQVFCYALERDIEAIRDIGCSDDEKRLAARTQVRIWDFARTHTGDSNHRLNYLLRLRERRAPKREIDAFNEASKALESSLLSQPPTDIIEALAQEAGLEPDSVLRSSLRSMWLKQHYDAAVKFSALIDSGSDLQEALEAAQAERRDLVAAYQSDREEAARQGPQATHVMDVSPSSLRAGDVPSAPAQSLEEPCSPAAGVPERVEPSAQAPEPDLTTFEEVVEQFCARNSKRTSAVKGARAVGRLFVAAVGSNKPMCTLSQEDLDVFVDLLRHRLPTTYGQKKADRDGGMPAVLERAKTLPPDQIGVSPQTEAKHLCYLGQVIGFASKRRFRPTAYLETSSYGKERADEKAARDRGRSNWTPEEFERLLQSPAFTGSVGPDRSERNEPGKRYYHDADYWMPIMLALTGARSSELGGLRLDDVHTNETIPYIRIFWNGERRVKTGASTRKLPVHPEMLRLGFLDYVAAMRAQGQNLLFPELEPGQDTTATFASVYYKHFKYLRDFAFPHGTSALKIKGGRKSDKDVHSFRGMVTNLMKNVRSETRTAILGHNQRTTAANVYEDFPLEELLAALAHTSKLTSQLQPIPISLNPVALGPRRRLSS
jgi:integrase